MIRQAFVVFASIVTFVIPMSVGLAVWFLAGSLYPEVRSLTAILGWVIAFGFSTQLFWRIIQRAFGRDGQ